ncbi:hypothetical protein BD560DRAFT_96919 [Blakeslea trispora]|nr:hypothetical protein BD560DRAFT_96919 [Blakeslea trispora]
MLDKIKDITDLNRKNRMDVKQKAGIHYNQIKAPKSTSRRSNYDEDDDEDFESTEYTEDSLDKEDIDEDDGIYRGQQEAPITSTLYDTVPTNIASHVVTASFFNGYGIAGGHAEDISVGLGLIGKYEQNEISGASSLLDRNPHHVVYSIVLLILIRCFFNRG